MMVNHWRILSGHILIKRINTALLLCSVHHLKRIRARIIQTLNLQAILWYMLQAATEVFVRSKEVWNRLAIAKTWHILKFCAVICEEWLLQVFQKQRGQDPFKFSDIILTQVNNSLKRQSKSRFTTSKLSACGSVMTIRNCSQLALMECLHVWASKTMTQSPNKSCKACHQ